MGDYHQESDDHSFSGVEECKSFLVNRPSDQPSNSGKTTFQITRSGDPTNRGAMNRPCGSFADYPLRISKFASSIAGSLSFAGFPASSEMCPLLQNPLLFCEKSPSRNCCIPRQFASDVSTYPPRPTGSLREILGQPGQSCQKISKPKSLKDMGLANPSEISLEQQTDSQTSKSPAIIPHQHPIHTTSGATTQPPARIWE